MHLTDDLWVNTTAFIAWPDSVVTTRDYLQTTIGDISIVDGDHCGNMAMYQRVCGGILMRRKPCATGQLEVDLLFVQHRRFSQQHRRHVGEGASA